jgi:hypothetical protein
MSIMSGIKRPPEYESPEPVPKTKARRTDPMTLEQALDRIAILENRLKHLDTPAVRLSVWLMESHINRSFAMHKGKQKVDVSAVEVPAEIHDLLHASDAATFAELLRASTTSFYHGIYHDWEYAYVTMRTKEFISEIWRLARLPNGFRLSIDLLVWFSIDVLHRPDSCFGGMLNSQCLNIYWLLDDALLYIALEQWEKALDNWDVRDTITEIEFGIATVAPWECTCYFTKSLGFLKESHAVFDIRSRVMLAAGTRLPSELVEEIVRYLLYELELPTGDLKTLHDWRSK